MLLLLLAYYYLSIWQSFPILFSLRHIYIAYISLQELQGVESVTANDYSADAVESIRRNVVENGLDPTTTVLPSHSDAKFVELCLL